MTSLNSQQLAFILDIKKEDARAKMCVAWCKAKGIPNKAERDTKSDGTRTGKVKDPYPAGMPIDLLAEHLNLPTLQQSVDDITTNFLTRPGSKKWILCDLPEKLKLKAQEEGKPVKFAIPPALRSMLPDDQIEFIRNQWKINHQIV
jgi:hypothetical protein